MAWHRLLGVVALGLVLTHVGALYVLSPEDTRFARSTDGPTRGRMALLATVALLVVVMLGLLRERLPMALATWRILHGAGTVVLLVLAVVAPAGVLATRLRPTRRP